MRKGATDSFKPHGTIKRRLGKKSKNPYQHQRDAMANLTLMDRELDDFSTLVVIPTGGGKTFTLAVWLLENAINKKAKVIWIAHTHILLEQAVGEFSKSAYKDVLPDVSSFEYRVVSGSERHDSFSDIKPTDAVLILGVQSLSSNLGKSKEFSGWLEGEDTIYLVIDEAHHAAAKSYRRIMLGIRDEVSHLKLIGITATPFRTRESEKGVLGKLFKDGVRDGAVCPGESVVAYEISLNELIKRQILSKPRIKECPTNECFDDDGCEYNWESIQKNDDLPDAIKKRMEKNARRNLLIVDHYLRNRKRYGQTIVFVLGRDHAIQLNRLFQKRHVKSGYVISGPGDLCSSAEESGGESAIEKYKRGDLEVLIGVNKLTEGVDAPKTQTVFLARPTSSDILMTQMVGRALRGVEAEGTEEAFIVSFVDNWSQHVAWARPTDIVGSAEFDDFVRGGHSGKQGVVSTRAIEAFADALSDEIGSDGFASLPFTSKVPIGEYIFSLIEYPELEAADLVERPCRILVYSSTAQIYENFMLGLGELFDSCVIEEREVLADASIEGLLNLAIERYFDDDMVPSYDATDIKHAIEYYAMVEQAPDYYSFDELDTANLNFSRIAQDIVKRDVKSSKRRELVDRVWDEDSTGMLKKVFRSPMIYNRLLCAEALRILCPELFKEGSSKMPEDGITYAPLDVIEELDPDYYEYLDYEVCGEQLLDDGSYECGWCGFSSSSRKLFKIVYDQPLCRGGLSIPENLDLFCNSCAAMMEEALTVNDDDLGHYTPDTLASVINSNDMGFRETVEFLNWVFTNESDYLPPEHRYSEKRFIRDAMDSIFWDFEYEPYCNAIQHALILRIKALYFSRGNAARTTMRHVLEGIGKKRRSERVCKSISSALKNAGVSLCRNGRLCNIVSISLDAEMEIVVDGYPQKSLDEGNESPETQVDFEAQMKLIESLLQKVANSFKLSETEQNELAILQRKILKKPKKGERANDFGTGTRVRKDDEYVALFCEGLLVAAYSKVTRRVYLIRHDESPAYQWDYPTSQARRVREFIGQMRHIRYVKAKDELAYEDYVTEVRLLSGANVHIDVGHLFDQFDMPYRRN